MITLGGVTLKKGVHYTVSYKNNKKITGADTKAVPTMTITGKGGLKGTLKRTFSITAPDIRKLSFEYKFDVKYTNKKNNYKQKIVVRDSNGAVLKQGVDYTVIYTLENNIENVLKNGDKVPRCSYVTAYVTGIGNYASPHKVACLYTVV